MDFASVPQVLHEPLARWWERAAQPAFLDGYAALSLKLRAELPRAGSGDTPPNASGNLPPAFLPASDTRKAVVEARIADLDGGDVNGSA